MEYEKIIDGLAYVKDFLNTIPVSGAETCQKLINAVININITIEQLQKEKEKEQGKKEAIN